MTRMPSAHRERAASVRPGGCSSDTPVASSRTRCRGRGCDRLLFGRHPDLEGTSMRNMQRFALVGGVSMALAVALTAPTALAAETTAAAAPSAPYTAIVVNGTD